MRSNTREVTVKKDELLSTLRQNRSQHETEYQEAMKAWRIAVRSELRDRLDKAEGDDFDFHLLHINDLPEPQDYSDSFDEAIAMFEWEVGDEVTLDANDFRRYVMNKWEWQQQFAASTAMYLS